MLNDPWHSNGFAMKNYRVILEGKNFLLDLDGAAKNEGTDAPVIYLHEMAGLTSLEDIAAPGSGYSFYEDDAGGVK